MERICLIASDGKGRIAPEIYGHFAEHLGGVFRGGLWVGEDSEVPNIRGFRRFVVEKFRAIRPPVLRYPGGCFAETYNWRDGIGPRAHRPKTLNWWYRDDRRVETNEVGTHEFVDFCRMTGAQPYLAGNLTSMTPLDLRKWMEYCDLPAGTTTLAAERAENGDSEPLGIRFWGIGNENWGGGGNMTPEMYAREYVRYATICHSANVNGARYVACGANGFDVAWTERFMRAFTEKRAPLWGLSFHYYCGGAGDPVAFTEAEWDTLVGRAAQMQELIERHKAAMLTFDPKREIKIVVDEWGCWHPDGSGPSRGYNLFEQQSTMRDAVIAALTLNIFNNNCDVVAMANVAQLCNNLHCLFLADGEYEIVTPTYHVFDLYKEHQGARHIHTAGASDKLSVSASEKNGVITVTMANLSFGEAREIELSSFDVPLGAQAVWTVLACEDPHAHNTFETPDAVTPGVPQTLPVREGKLTLTLPAAAVARLEIRL